VKCPDTAQKKKFASAGEKVLAPYEEQGWPVLKVDTKNHAEKFVRISIATATAAAATSSSAAAASPAVSKT